MLFGGKLHASSIGVYCIIRNRQMIKELTALSIAIIGKNECNYQHITTPHAITTTRVQFKATMANIAYPGQIDYYLLDGGAVKYE